VPVLPLIDEPNLVAWWTFDEGAGSASALDWSGNGRHGTLMGDTDWVDGFMGSALVFDGDGDHVNIDGYKGVLGSHAFSITAWMKKTATEDSSIVSWGTQENNQRADFRLNNIRTRFETGGGAIEGVTTDVVTDGEWHHVAVTVAENATVGSPGVTLYLDGENDTPIDEDPDALDIVAGADVSIGSRGTTNSRFLNGALDDVRIYDKELTQAEVQAIAGPLADQ